ncbi:transcription initiation factor TFIID subunit 14b-like [Rutidosis leptorrhynchoides]|uniref:transcription initiation factor TFIID subunit 14b-like n=1 Tax=Rutidosis leptorrhynchoides TaxID=125765 RepID=UPI003A98CFFE
MTGTDQNDNHSHAVEESDSTPHQTIDIQPQADTKSSMKKTKDLEVSVPIAYGTISFWLGRKATETQSHTWTVYVRGATNEDLSVVIKKVIFQLHPSFNNARRVVESPPFELTERGWGEFEIAISIFFHDDVCEKQLDLFHHLKLYSEVEHGPLSTKKPVIVESYNEIVFPNPSLEFLSRVLNHPSVIVPRLPATLNLPPAPIEDVHAKKRGDTKDHPLGQWFNRFSEADELLKLAEARQQVQTHITKLKRRLSMLEGSSPTQKPR